MRRLQASNEELETLNEELQATVEELNTVNDVVSAQARQTQTSFADVLEQQRATDVERARLQAILQSIGDVVLVLDATGVIVLKNQA